MPTFKLDGQDIPFEPGDTIISAAWKQGIEIPHYCWHPGLSIAANCRMCLVEIKTGRKMMLPILEWDAKKNEFVPNSKPKLQPACQMPAAEEMEVETKSDHVKKAQSAVQEFLLLNHPVDCPICDQAGECKLQDYWLEHQGTEKRKRTEPVHKPKGVRFGPTIVYDAERCIMCTRCIRVCDEVAGDVGVLDMRQRGNKNEIFVAQGRELDHDYTLMTEHVCPVGALTSQDFRFKARVWFLKAKKTICPGCATGCNAYADYDPRNNVVYRLRPRDNMDVNKFWMCDDGMMTYRRITTNRLVLPTEGRGADQDEMMPSEAVDAAASMLRGSDWQKVGIVFSAQHSTEDNYALAELARQLGTTKFYITGRGGWKADEILRHADNNPNHAGAVRAAAVPLDENLSDLVSDVLAAEVTAIISLGSDCAEEVAELTSLRKVEHFVALATHDTPLPALANLVVPVAAWAESHGTFENAQGHRQTFKRVVPPPPGVKPAWETLRDIAKSLELPLGFDTIKDIRAALTASAEGVEATEQSPEAQA